MLAAQHLPAAVRLGSAAAAVVVAACDRSETAQCYRVAHASTPCEYSEYRCEYSSTDVVAAGGGSGIVGHWQ